MRSAQDIWAGSFVEEGAVVVRDLGFEKMIAPIPDDESAIASLVPGKNGRVFGLTVGLKSHFFVYNDFPLEDCVIKIGVMAENASAAHLVCTSAGMIYGVVCSDAAGGKTRTVLFRHDPVKDFIGGELSLSTGKPVALPCPFETRKVLKFVMDRSRDVAYGLLAPGNVLFSYEVASGKFAEVADLGEGKISPVLCVAEDGTVYGVGAEGAVFRFAPESGRVEFTKMEVPCGKGKEYVNEASALIAHPTKPLLYGGTLVDGYLFKIDLAAQRVICLGKPMDQRPIRCLTVGNDGTVFGVAGEPKNGMCHLFRYSPETGDLRDLGVLRATIFKSWVAHEIDAMCTNRNGHIVLGENDRMSNLFVYFPPIRPSE